MGWPQNPMMIPQLKDPHFGENLAQVLGWAGTPITQEKPFLMQYCMRFIRDAEAKLITHTGAEEIDPQQLQLRVFKWNKTQRKGKLSKHHKNGDDELLQLISYGKVTGYLLQTFLVPYTMSQVPGWVKIVVSQFLELSGSPSGHRFFKLKAKEQRTPCWALFLGV